MKVSRYYFSHSSRRNGRNLFRKGLTQVFVTWSWGELWYREQWYEGPYSRLQWYFWIFFLLLYFLEQLLETGNFLRCFIQCCKCSFFKKLYGWNTYGILPGLCTSSVKQVMQQTASYLQGSLGFKIDVWVTTCKNLQDHTRKAPALQINKLRGK